MRRKRKVSEGDVYSLDQLESMGFKNLRVEFAGSMIYEDHGAYLLLENLEKKKVRVLMVVSGEDSSTMDFILGN